MNVIPFGVATRRGLRRFASAAHVWAATRTLNLAAATPRRADAPRMPPCVWCGRSVFCFHASSVPSPTAEREH